MSNKKSGIVAITVASLILTKVLNDKSSNSDNNSQYFSTNSINDEFVSEEIV